PDVRPPAQHECPDEQEDDDHPDDDGDAEQGPPEVRDPLRARAAGVERRLRIAAAAEEQRGHRKARDQGRPDGPRTTTVAHLSDGNGGAEGPRLERYQPLSPAKSRRPGAGRTPRSAVSSRAWDRPPGGAWTPAEAVA